MYSPPNSPYTSQIDPIPSTHTSSAAPSAVSPSQLAAPLAGAAPPRAALNLPSGRTRPRRLGLSRAELRPPESSPGRPRVSPPPPRCREAPPQPAPKLPASPVQR
ncbi:hypothetical protein PVAP13_4NG013862 [Panicum virgatum]|uniref:Uncharacterized protein n=1 Tax=Panicum virgatum TaxID=38727 RepID=A0A8T0T3I2_PANVG|nr:hypothetical protein PVAP13_4NG013862 [Panicum virgatum]